MKFSNGKWKIINKRNSMENNNNNLKNTTNILEIVFDKPSSKNMV